MADKLLPLKVPPGIVRAGTALQTQGRWYDGNLVRFVAGTIQPIGGWQRAPNASGGSLAQLTGVPRAVAAWRSDDGGIWLAVGTTEKLYLIAGGERYDITPAGLPAGREKTEIPGTLVSGQTQGSSHYGDGTYNSGRYGEGSTLGVRYDADLWSLDVFGQYLVGVFSADRKLYLWQGAVGTPAAEPTDAPVDNIGVVCTPERFLMVLGAGGNVRKVQWPSQETTDDWTPRAENSAGDFELSTKGALLTGARTRKETLLWTDADLWTVTYVGGELIYRFDQAGEGCGLIAPNAKAVFDAQAIWMGTESFFTYDGYVRPLPCDLHDYVFSDINRTQVRKIWTQTIAEHGEVWFYYPSGASEEVDRYVVFNYREGHWSKGDLARTAGADAGPLARPTKCSPDGYIYEHEIGDAREGEVFLESGPIQLGDGDQVMTVLRVVPDERTLGDVSATFFARMQPMGTEREYAPVTLDDDQSVRFTARLVRVRFTENEATDWRIGIPSFAVAPGGRR